jgi:poly(beta-D-mannuronate) lyase
MSKEIPMPNEIPEQTKFNEKNWKLTIPIKDNNAENAKEILPPFENTIHFVKQSDNSFQMTAPVNGATTKGSSYPRCEFREMNLDGSKAAWSTASEKHTMIYTSAVTQFPPVKQQVVTGQIHDSEDDVIMIRHTNNKKLIEVIQDTTKYGILDENYEIGQKYTICIKVDNGTITVLYKKSVPTGVVSTSVTIPNMKYNGCYFKVGCYTQSNVSKESSEDGAGSVRLYGATVTHEKNSSAPAPKPSTDVPIQKPVPSTDVPIQKPVPSIDPSNPQQSIPKPSCIINFDNETNSQKPTIICYGTVYINGSVYIKPE